MSTRLSSVGIAALPGGGGLCFWWDSQNLVLVHPGYWAQLQVWANRGASL